jgi:hypothetical protein
VTYGLAGMGSRTERAFWPLALRDRYARTVTIGPVTIGPVTIGLAYRSPRAAPRRARPYRLAKLLSP